MYDIELGAEKAPTGETESNPTTDSSTDQRAVADGGTSWRDLTGFQRDLLEAIQRLEATGIETSGATIRQELESLRGEDITHGRLYQNLDQLVGAGLVEKGSIDDRTNRYALTRGTRRMLEMQIHLLADAFGVHLPITDGGEPA